MLIVLCPFFLQQSSPFQSEHSSLLYMENVKILFVKILFLSHTFSFLSQVYFIYSLPFIPIIFLKILYKLWLFPFNLIHFPLSRPVSTLHVSSRINLFSADFIMVFISRSLSLLSSASSSFTSCCLAKRFLNYYISVLFCLRSWLFFFFLRWLLH